MSRPGVLYRINPLLILVCLGCGAAAGRLWPELGELGWALGQAYLGVVGMAAIPLMVVATVFGIRRLIDMPQPMARTLMVVILGSALLAACAALATMSGIAVGVGNDISPAQRNYLGSAVLLAGDSAADSKIELFAEPPKVEANAGTRPWVAVVPDNFFRALTSGQSVGILMCSILFGLAFAMVVKRTSQPLMGVLEAIYRSLENIIFAANRFIPVLVFGLSAHFATVAEWGLLRAMGSFLVVFLVVCCAVGIASTLILWRTSGGTYGDVLSSLRTPMLISLTSASPYAAIPDTIHALSARLGYSRGMVELMVPLSAAIMRAGNVVFFSLLAVFVSNLYGRELQGIDILVIVAGAMLATIGAATTGVNGLGQLAGSGVVLTWLKLPAEAVLPLFLAIDLVCEGPRQLVSLLTNCMLISSVCQGLPSERREFSAAADAEPEPATFTFTRKSAAIGVACLLVAGALTLTLGFAVGKRVVFNTHQGEAAMENDSLLPHNQSTTK